MFKRETVCEKCIKDDVCNQEEKFEKIANDLSKMDCNDFSSDNRSNIEVILKCPYYYPKTAGAIR
jgi:hypothetical protein